MAAEKEDALAEGDLLGVGAVGDQHVGAGRGRGPVGERVGDGAAGVVARDGVARPKAAGRIVDRDAVIDGDVDSRGIEFELAAVIGHAVEVVEADIAAECADGAAGRRAAAEGVGLVVDGGAVDAAGAAVLVVAVDACDQVVFVDQAIAVVVVVVAGLDDGGGTGHSVAGERAARVGGITGCGAGAAAGADAREADAATTGPLGVFVGAAVAVIVEAIADLGPSGTSNSGALGGAGGAGCAADLHATAEADALARAADRATVAPEGAIVHGAITVVVEAVADLGASSAGRHGADRRAGLVRGVADLHTGALADARATLADVAAVGPEGAVIDGTVAVVVDAIAGLGLRRLVGDTGVGARDAGGEALRADAGSAGVAGDAAARVAIVDGAVAVVVEAIAELGGEREHLADAAREAADRAGLNAGAADAHARGRGHAVVAGAGDRSAGRIFVGAAVAVVVEAIAALEARRPQRLADNAAGGADGGSLRADALLTGGAERARLGVSVVYRAVAVVIDAVAELGRERKHLAHAAAEVARVAALHAAAADANAGRCRNTVVAGAGDRIAKVILVTKAVAIVVEAVADLFVWQQKRQALESRRGADRGALGTDAELAGGAERAAFRVVVVDEAVAVVVEPIAELLIRNHVAHAAAILTERAGLNATLAEAHIQRRVAAVVAVAGQRVARGIFVLDAVAVVVEAVADLGRGGEEGGALGARVAAGSRASGADAGEAGRAGATACRAAIVRQAVAVVVEQVAELGLRHHISDAGAVLAARAGLKAGVALANVDVAGVTVEADTRDGSASIILIHRAVAIIVNAVADLDRSGDLGHAADGAGITQGLAQCTSAGAARCAVATGLRITFVNGAVAVVIQPVAELALRKHRADAVREEAVGAAPLARRAGAHAQRRRGAVVTGLLNHEAVAGLVHRAIAVVVDAVAEFGFRRTRRDALNGRAVADRPARPTDARKACVAVCVHAHRVVIHIAVAVVVDAVAELIGRRVDAGTVVVAIGAQAGRTLTKLIAVLIEAEGVWHTDKPGIRRDEAEEHAGGVVLTINAGAAVVAAEAVTGERVEQDAGQALAVAALLAGVAELPSAGSHIGLNGRVAGVAAITAVRRISAAAVGGVAGVGPRVLTILIRRPRGVAATTGSSQEEAHNARRLKETVDSHMHSPRSRIAALINQFDIGVAFGAKD